jgi:hypothetical protein
MASLTIDCDYDGVLVIVPGPDYLIDDTDSLSIGTNPGPVAGRGFFRFPLTSLPAGQTITLAQFQCTVEQEQSGEDRSHYIGPYNTNGSGDPQTDAGTPSSMASKTDIASNKYLTTTDFQSVGNKVIDITAGAAAHIAARAGLNYSLVIEQTDETTDATKGFKMFGEDQEPGLVPPDHIPQLYLEYSPASSAEFPAYWRWRT